MRNEDLTFKDALVGKGRFLSLSLGENLSPK